MSESEIRDRAYWDGYHDGIREIVLFLADIDVQQLPTAIRELAAKHDVRPVRR